MKQLLLAILTFITVAACCQTPVKYSVVIGNDYIQVDPSGSLDTVSTVNIEPKEYQAVLTVNGALSPNIGSNQSEYFCKKESKTGIMALFQAAFIAF